MKKGILLLPLVALMGEVQAAERYDWTGFYAGANLGMSTFQTDTRDYWCWYACDAPNTVEDGVTYGIQTGYNYQVDNTFVVGVELDYQTGQDSSTTVKFNPTDGVNWDSEWKSLMSLRLKAGLAADRTLVYVTGGIAQADAEFSAAEFDPTPSANGLDRANKDETLSGYIYGMGVEHAFTDLISARMEYLTTSMESADACWRDDTGCNNSTGANDDFVAWNTSNSSIRLGVNMLF